MTIAYEWPLDPTIEQRFWAKVEMRLEDDCWRWTAFLRPDGYGMIRNGHRMATAHRVAWALTHGAIPPGMHVLHHCDNPACVNPAHLYVGTNDDNVADKVARGRSSFPQPNKRGEKHPLAKLSADDVAQIRSSVTGRHGERAEMAAKYGVSRATITNILKRKVWK